MASFIFERRINMNNETKNMMNNYNCIGCVRNSICTDESQCLFDDSGKFPTTYDVFPMKKLTYNPIEKAYYILLDVINNKESDIADYSIAIEEAIGYLGEALE